MFCGSCMQDNTLARSLQQAGLDVTLVPTYTPIRVDEYNVSDERVFLGGINVYLDSALPGWSRLPGFLKSWLDRPEILRRLAKRSSSTDATQLGWLTVDMLRGVKGPQRKEIRQLVSWLTSDLQPDVILFSNALLSGIVPTLREQFSGPIVCLLQGDDIFLEALPDRWQTPSIDLVRENCGHFDRLWTHSRYYADYLSSLVGLEPKQFDQIPLSLDCDLPKVTASQTSRGQVIGYFARICPDKGADHFLHAAQQLAHKDNSLQFRIAGYLLELHEEWFRTNLKQAQETIGEDRLQWVGSPATRDDKFAYLKSLDLLCVPTRYHEPKGLFVLEAALSGVPALVPNHGAFPELISGLGNGRTYHADSTDALNNTAMEMLTERTDEQSAQLRSAVTASHSMDITGPRIGQMLARLLEPS